MESFSFLEWLLRVRSTSFGPAGSTGELAPYGFLVGATVGFAELASETVATVVSKIVTKPKARTFLKCDIARFLFLDR
jgi:hypothetical protein